MRTRCLLTALLIAVCITIPLLNISYGAVYEYSEDDGANEWTFTYTWLTAHPDGVNAYYTKPHNPTYMLGIDLYTVNVNDTAGSNSFYYKVKSNESVKAMYILFNNQTAVTSVYYYMNYSESATLLWTYTHSYGYKVDDYDIKVYVTSTDDIYCKFYNGTDAEGEDTWVTTSEFHTQGFDVYNFDVGGYNDMTFLSGYVLVGIEPSLTGAIDINSILSLGMLGVCMSLVGAVSRKR